MSINREMKSHWSTYTLEYTQASKREKKYHYQHHGWTKIYTKSVRKGNRNIIFLTGGIYKFIEMNEFINRNRLTDLENQVVII